MNPILILQFIFLITVNVTLQSKVGFGLGGSVTAGLRKKIGNEIDTGANLSGNLSSNLGLDGKLNTETATKLGGTIDTGLKNGIENDLNTKANTASSFNTETNSKADTEFGSILNLGAKANTEAGLKSNLDTATTSAINAGTALNTNIASNAEAGLKSNAEAGLKSNAEAGLKSNAEAGLKSNAEAGLKSNIDLGAKSNLDAGLATNLASNLKKSLESALNTSVGVGVETNVKTESHLDKGLNSSFNVEGNVTLNKKPVDEEIVVEVTTEEVLLKDEGYYTKIEDDVTAIREREIKEIESNEDFKTDTSLRDTMSDSTESITTTEPSSKSSEKVEMMSDTSSTSTSSSEFTSTTERSTERSTRHIDRTNTPFERRQNTSINGNIEVLRLNENNEMLTPNKEKEDKDVIRNLLYKKINDAGYKHYDMPYLSNNTEENIDVNTSPKYKDLADEPEIEVDDYDENIAKKLNDDRIRMFDNSEIMETNDVKFKVEPQNSNKTSETELYKNLFMTLAPKVNQILNDMSSKLYENGTDDDLVFTIDNSTLYDLNNSNDTLLVFIQKCYMVNNCFTTMILCSTATLILVIIILIFVCACYGYKKQSRYNHYNKHSNRIYRTTTVDLNPKKKEEIPLV
jgi:hypothetical protein